MKIFQATLDNLELAADWATTRTIAEARKVHQSTLLKSLDNMVRAGLLEKRKERQAVTYRITGIGKSTLEFHRAHARVCKCCGETKPTMCFTRRSNGTQSSTCNACRLAHGNSQKPVKTVPVAVEVKYPMPWPWKYNGKVYGGSAYV